MVEISIPLEGDAEGGVDGVGGQRLQGCDEQHLRPGVQKCDERYEVVCM